MIERIKKIRAREEFSLSQSEYLDLLDKKMYYSHIETIFQDDIKKIRGRLNELKYLYEQQLQGSSSQSFKDEESLLKIIRVEFDTIEHTKQDFTDYIHQLKSLHYSKRWINGVQFVLKKFGRIFMKLKIEGQEHIPKKGPCIIAPHYYHAQVDPSVLISLIPRKLFFTIAVETFIAIPVLEKFFKKMGYIPIKRNEDHFTSTIGPRKKLRFPFHKMNYEKVNRYQASNYKHIRAAVKHLYHGDAVVVFPEWDAHVDGTYQRPKSSTGEEDTFLPPDNLFVFITFLANRMKNLNVPIVPVGLHHTDGGLRNDVVVRIGKPYYLPHSLQSLDGVHLKKELAIHANKLFEQIKKLSS